MAETAPRQPQPPVEDPFLAALEAAELDDEPFTDEERAAVEEGEAQFRRGESVPWEVVRRELLGEEIESADASD